MTVDVDGNLYIAVRSEAAPGVHIYTPQGKELAYISTGKELPTNVAFGSHEGRWNGGARQAGASFSHIIGTWRNSMIKLTAFRSVPPFAQGLVRDLRVRWALEEAGVPYQERLMGGAGLWFHLLWKSASFPSRPGMASHST